MKKLKYGSLFFLFFILFVLNTVLFAATPMETVQASVNAALDVLKDPAMKGEAAKEAKEKKLWAIANTFFDFSELSKRTLGKNWKKLTSDQQREFTDLFSTLLGNLYLDRILSYSNEKVVFNKEKKKKNKAIVYSSIIQDTRTIPINYRAILKNGEWKVYDVLVEGVSLVKNYRSQFKEILMKKDPDYLLKTLRQKVEKQG